MAHIEVLVVRDPDGGTATTILVDGVETTEYVEYVVDAGAGHMRDEWDTETAAVQADRDMSEAFRAAVLDARQDPPGSEYIDDKEW